VLRADQPEAIEVELTAKAARRLDAIPRLAPHRHVPPVRLGPLRLLAAGPSLR
jgi:hypothetical protein